MRQPLIAMYFVWFAWAISWSVAAGWAAPAAVRVGLDREWIYRTIRFWGLFLLFLPLRIWVLWRLGAGAAWACVGIGALGFVFAWWARIHLGRLWSSAVTKKADHRVVDTGPYALARHPIYTGIIAAALATAAIQGTAIAAAGAVLLIVAYFIKARLEEHFLREQLGAEAYDSYRRRVPMLLPFGPKSA